MRTGRAVLMVAVTALVLLLLPWRPVQGQDDGFTPTLETRLTSNQAGAAAAIEQDVYFFDGQDAASIFLIEVDAGIVDTSAMTEGTEIANFKIVNPLCTGGPCANGVCMEIPFKVAKTPAGPDDDVEVECPVTCTHALLVAAIGGDPNANPTILYRAVLSRFPTGGFEFWITITSNVEDNPIPITVDGLGLDIPVSAVLLDGFYTLPDSGSVTVKTTLTPPVTGTEKVFEEVFELEGGTAPEFIRMDIDEDGKARLSDVIVFLSLYLFGTEKTLACPDAADANDDGKLGLTDAIYILSFIFLPEAIKPPAMPPYPECGEDETADSLSEKADDPEKGCVFPRCEGP